MTATEMFFICTILTNFLKQAELRALRNSFLHRLIASARTHISKLHRRSPPCRRISCRTSIRPSAVPKTGFPHRTAERTGSSTASSGHTFISTVAHPQQSRLDKLRIHAQSIRSSVASVIVRVESRVAPSEGSDRLTSGLPTNPPEGFALALCWSVRNST